MATTFTADTFDVSVLPGGLNKDARDLCQGAVAFGWKVMVKHIMVRLISPDGEHTITLSASNKNIPFKRHKDTILKHANPLLIPKDDQAIDQWAKNIVIAGDLAQEKRAKQEAQRVTLAPKPKPIVSARKLPNVPVERIAHGRYVVSEAPMLAHRGQGKAYPSPTTNQREWSDGTVDYACRSEGCDFSSDNRMGIGPHWRSHVNRGEEENAGKPTETYVVPPHEPAYTKDGYTPRRDRVSGLAAVLAALDLAQMSPEEIAEFVLNWQHQQSETGSRLAAEREEMTSDDVLNRIRSLLDNGTYLRQQEEIEALKSDRDLAHLALEQAQTEAREAKEKWDTLRSLMEDA